LTNVFEAFQLRIALAVITTSRVGA
jgi:hypothetical protein